MEERFQTKDGRAVSINVLDDEYRIEVRQAETDREIGHFEFDEVEFPEPTGALLKLMWSHLDGCDGSYKRQGIGTRILELARECWGMPIFAEDDNGHRLSDGSHLTNEAPAFVAAMREKGLLIGSSEDDNDA